MGKMRLMSHNQWKCDDNFPDWEKMGMDCSAETRIRGFVQVYREIQPDIVGCQEVSAVMADKLIRYLAEDGQRYALLWGRDTPILYRQDKFELLDSDFFLYPTEVPGYAGSFNNGGSKSWCLAVFRERESGKNFIFMTTHLWWKSSNPEKPHYQPGSAEARAYQIGLAADRISEYAKRYQCPQILVGDLNGGYESAAVQTALSRGFVHAHDVAVEYADETKGHHKCDPSGVGPYTDEPFVTGIDHILVKDVSPEFVRRFERYSPEYYLPLSDHSPVFVDVEW